MALDIETFDNARGGQTFFKAVGHPLAVPAARRLTARLAAAGPVAVYDPLGTATSFAALHDLSGVNVAHVFIQSVADIGKRILGKAAQPVTDLAGAKVSAVLVPCFDAGRLIAHVRHLVPPGAEVVSLDELRLPDDMLANPRNYLDPNNFATNFAFFRDVARPGDSLHTRIVTANYWSGYGARSVSLWLNLFDDEGRTLASWREPAPPGPGGIVIDSRRVRERFGLGDFTGQMFLHVIGATGHDVVKYALDVFGDRPEALSCTHDANAWPADYYAGLPAPRADERVVLWVQNSHCCPIPAGAVSINLMGGPQAAPLAREIAPFASYPLDVSALLPQARWPQQIEINAGRHMVRPRYEVVNDGRRRIAHPNVERTDLRPDPRIPELANLLGKGFILPAPVLPPARFRTVLQPTPMARAQAELPIAVRVYDASGAEVANRFLGRMKRDQSLALDIGEIARAEALRAGYGHLELLYDFRDGGEADGWLHALFRYEDRASGHAAETSFGAHVFNTVLTYKGEPQSYVGRPPGLSTRLFLRLGVPPLDTLCHLIYPASTPWHPLSATVLALHDRDGAEIARREVAIPCGGSLLWRARETFGTELVARAGEGGYVLIRDTTCRLFGYHGLLDGDRAFSLDHMFGF